jgi:antitoxin PrlF
MNSYSIGMKTTVSEKGQITIPKRIRDKLGLKPGTLLDLEAHSGKLVGVKRLDEDPFEKWSGAGRLPDGMSIARYLRISRG